MQQLLTIWNGLSIAKKATTVAAVVGVFFAVLAMTRMASSPSMTLLYAGLEPAAAGEVIASLEARGVAYDVRGASIFVSSAERDQMRMVLASEGLPANGASGYELLDSLSGFGTTSQMFDAAYWRAKEGELARTISSSPYIKSARVHIANTASSPFQRGVKPTASVAISAARGELTNSQAKALRFLVASAVAGLSPDDVAVIGASGALVGSNDEPSAASAQDERAQALREKVQRLLEARVGFGNAVVEVSVDTVTERESVRERRFDPEGRVAISTDTEETTNSSNETGNGQVTVASNLPDGDADGGADSSNSQNSQTRERVNYEVSETEREILRTPGAIKRLSVAVLVNGQSVEGDDGISVIEPRSQEELDTLRELVASAVGFDDERGDVITIKSMELQSVEPTGTSAPQSLFSGLDLDLVSMIQMAVLALVTLILGLFVIRPVLSGGARNQTEAVASLPPAEFPRGDQSTPISSETTPIFGEIAGTDEELPSLGDLGSPGGPSELPELPALGEFGHSEDPADRLRSLIDERKTETVEILRGWLNEEEEHA